MDRYYRQVTASVLQFYLEFEDGLLPRERMRGEYFEPRIIDYRIDVDRVLKMFPPHDVVILMAVHRDGLAHADALRQAKVVCERPSDYVDQLEVRVGKLLDRKNMLDFLAYIRS